MKKRIYIVTKDDYCGGTLVLCALCKTIRQLGYDARLIVLPFFPRQKINRLRFICSCIVKNLKYRIRKLFLNNETRAGVLNLDGIKVQWHPFFMKNRSIVIYPEIVYGNPLGAKYVARWLLYNYAYKHDKEAYSKDDLFFAFREVFNDSDLNSNNYVVTIRYFDKELYRQFNFNTRNGNCYIIQKGKNRLDLPTEFDGPALNYNMTQEEVVDMFNNHKYCYCYDPQTFYLKIAAVCGCIPIMVMEEGKTEKDYLSSSEQHYGIAYGDTPEQIQYAIDTRDLCIKSLDYSNSNILDTQKLISILKNQWV